jgi:Family of unknown function (DUF5681)
MSQNPRIRLKRPSKHHVAKGAMSDGAGPVETDADAPSDLAEAGTTRPGSEVDYAVGYGRPPKHTRFKPGKSGNPKGRSPQSRNLKTIVKEVFDEQMPIREGGRVRRMAAIEALVRMTMSRAFKGDLKALASLIVMMKQAGYGNEHADITPELLQGLDHESIIAEFRSRLALDDSAKADPSADEPTEGPAPSEKGKS